MTTFSKSIACLLLILTTAVISAPGQNLFTEITIELEKQNHFQNVFWFDDNNDGLYDFIFERDSSIYLNNGDATFSLSNRKVPETGYVWQLTDFDQNGTVDVLSSIGLSEIYAMLNMTNGSFQIKELTVAPEASAYRWVDLEGDGDLDYPYSSEYKYQQAFSNKLWASINENGQLSTPINFNYEVHLKSSDLVYTIDMEKDGDLDLLVSNHDEEGPVRIYKCIEDFNYVLDTIFFVPAAYNGRITVADVNNDGYEDFLHTNSYGAQLFINEGGSFRASPQEFEYRWYNTADWGDFDNDGDLDLVYTRCAGGQSELSVYRNNGDETFEEIPIMLRFYESITAKWIDIDADGYLDLSVENYICRYWDDNCRQPYRIQFFLNNGEGAPNQQPPTPVGLDISIEDEILVWEQPDGDETSTDAMQFNLHLSSGAGNVVYPSSNLQTGSMLYPQQGNMRTNKFKDISDLKPGNYSAKVQSIDGGQKSSPFSATLNFEVKAPPTDLELNELQPGKISIAWGNPVSYELLIIERSCETEGFRPIDTIPGNLTEYIDLKVDFACGNITYRIKGKSSSYFSSYSSELQVDISKFSTTQFDFESDFWQAYDLDWADYDGDGDMDVVAFVYPNIFVYRNDSEGSYTMVQEIENPGKLFPLLTWIDIDQDNKPDIQAHYYTEGQFYFVNKGTDHFELINGENPFPPLGVLADIDQDAINEVIFYEENILYYSETDSIEPVRVFEFDHDLENTLLIFAQDHNGDQVPDIFLQGETSLYLQSDGKLNYKQIELPETLNRVKEHSNYKNQTTGDINNDGKLDFAYSFTDSPGYTERLGILSIDENGISELHTLTKMPSHNPMMYVTDFDNDGKSDLLVERAYEEVLETEITPVLYLQRADTFSFQQLTDHMEVRDLFEITDFDMDGDIDIICNGLYLETMTFVGMLIENKAADFYSRANVKPEPPASISVSYEPGNMLFEWGQGNDDLTVPQSLTYNIYLSKNSDYIISPLADLSDGSRFIQREGNSGLNRLCRIDELEEGLYRIAVQSIDQGFLGSEFTEEVEFAISAPPTLKQALPLNSTSVELQWEPVAEATGFIIKRSLSPTGPFHTIANVSAASNSYQDKELNRNTTYFYKLMYYGNNLLSAPLQFEYLNSDFIHLANENLPGENVYKTMPCDVNSDGFFDLAVLKIDRISLFENDGKGKYTLSNEILLSFPGPIDAIPTDVNNDNRIDFAIHSEVQNGITLLIQRNDGDFDSFDIEIAADRRPKNLLSADFDNDGTHELLYNNLLVKWNVSQSIVEKFMNSSSWLNDEFTQLFTVDFDHDLDIDVIYGNGLKMIKNNYPNENDNLVLCYQCTPDMINIGDFDANGSWDFMVLGSNDYSRDDGKLYLNRGDLSFEKINMNYTRYRKANTVVGDYDNNGFPDMLISGLRKDENQFTSYAIINKGENQLEFTRMISLSDTISELEFVDIDLDHDLDLIVTSLKNGLSGISTFVNTTFHLQSGIDNEAPSEPTDLENSVFADSVALSWSSATDNESSGASLSYNLQIKREDGDFALSPLSIENAPLIDTRHGNAGQNNAWFIRHLPPGDYRWKVQAIDGGKRLSNFSKEQEFQIQDPKVTGLQEEHFPVTIFPNPASSELYVNLSGGHGVDFIYISDVLGQVHFRAQIEERDISSGRKVIALNELKQGLYFINFETEQAFYSIKFLKK